MTRKKPPGKPGRPRQMNVDATPAELRKARKFAADLAELDITPDDFAERSGVHRARVYRILAADYPVPLWAEWIISLLRERAGKATPED